MASMLGFTTTHTGRLAGGREWWGGSTKPRENRLVEVGLWDSCGSWGPSFGVLLDWLNFTLVPREKRENDICHASSMGWMFFIRHPILFLFQPCKVRIINIILQTKGRRHTDIKCLVLGLVEGKSRAGVWTLFSLTPCPSPTHTTVVPVHSTLGMFVHAAIFKTHDQQAPTVQHGEGCSIFCNNLNGKGIWKRRDTCISITESLCCTPETSTPLLVNSTPV